jgi:DNA-binding LacI/PurR family transcriptional regulator
MVNPSDYNRLLARVEAIPGHKLPGERELAQVLGISRPRVRAALASLAAEGRVRRRQGSGTYAVEPEGRIRSVLLKVDSRLRLGGDPFFSHLVERLQARLQAQGIRCVIERVGEATSPECAEDAMVLVGLSAEALAERLPEDYPPAVVVPASREGEGSRVSWFGLEDRRAGRDAARNLRALGAQRLIFAGYNHLPVSAARLDGVRSESGEVEVIECGMNHAEGVDIARRIDPMPGERIGVIAGNDWLAVGLHAGLVGLSRRDRALLASFDGLPETQTRQLGISSMVVPVDQMADDAVAELQRLHRPGGQAGRWIRYLLHWRPAEQQGGRCGL